eukprot:Nk52_evm9s147 gene=Nk52_evmTU9s147
MVSKVPEKNSRALKSGTGGAKGLRMGTPPPFSLGQVKAAIPRHCFQRSYVTSLRYLAVDLFVVCALAYAAFHYLYGNSLLPWWTKGLLWGAYWYVQGACMTGLWIIAHECGHHAFSPSHLLNDTVGLILHTGLLLPYFSWKFSHAKHHKNTGSIENDEIFNPSTRQEILDTMGESFIGKGPLRLVIYLTFLLFGWPLYLTVNKGGPAKYKGVRNSHYDPYAALFSPPQRAFVVLTDLALVCTMAGMGLWIYHHGLLPYTLLYFVPYLEVNAYIVVITYLHHTHPKVPHLRDGDWTWLYGALCTIDRDFGWFLNTTHHHISDTHVCHHLFPKIPHYHAQEATEAIKKVLGPYYNYDSTPIWRAFVESVYECQYVEEKDPVAFYRGGD